MRMVYYYKKESIHKRKKMHEGFNSDKKTD